MVLSETEYAPGDDPRRKRRKSHPRAKPASSKPKKNIPGIAARQVATTLLTRVIDDGRGLDGLLDTRHGPAGWRDLDPVDQGLVRAIVTTVFRHRGEIEFALSKMLDRKLPQKARHLIHTLHVAAAQILFLDVPDSAAVNLAVQSLRDDKRSTRFASLANAVLRRISREKDDLFSKTTNDERARLNVPPWLWKRMRKDYGRDRAIQIAQAHMLEPVLDITVKSEPEKWAETFGGVSVFGNSVRVNAAGSVTEFPGFNEGDWWVQDAAASLPAYLLGDIAGKRVADLCAAPGGKTAQLIAMGANVTAVEQSGDRLVRLKANLERLMLEAEFVEADMFEWEPGELFDAILLDAPCSATGILRRQPDVKWHRKASDIHALVDLQARMLDALWPLLRPGGRLVYATCSVLRDENDRQIADFLARTDDAEDRTERPADAAPVAAGWQLLTRDNGPDGFYLACLHKRGAADDNKVTDQRS